MERWYKAGTTMEVTRSPRSEIMAPTDEELIDWLEQQAGAALVSDDDGRWAVSMSGFAPMPGTTEEWPPDTWEGISWVEKAEWRGSIRDALDAAMREAEGKGEERDG